MNVYVSGTLREVERARAVMRMIREAGHTVAFDWALDDAKFDYTKEPQRAAALAHAMREGVKACDALVFLHSGTALGALVETGMALYSGKPIAVVGTPKRRSIFYSLTDAVEEDAAVVGWLARVPLRSSATSVEVSRPRR